MTLSNQMLSYFASALECSFFYIFTPLNTKPLVVVHIGSILILITYKPAHKVLVLITYVNSKNSEEPVHLHSLTIAVTPHTHRVGMKMNA